MAAVEVTVVGGGITGMAAAWELVRGGARVTLLESSDRLGGKIVTEEIGGRAMDLGPDAFLSRLPDAMQLCHELGLDDELVGAATESASLWVGGRLRPLPPGTVLGSPAGLAGLAAVARSGILSPAGVARAGLDLVLPRLRLGEDPSVGEIVTGRFGRQVHERLVDPLVGGIHAGPSSLLSAEAVAPQMTAGARAHRSLLLGLQRARKSPASGTAFVSLRGGLGRLVGRLEEALRDEGVRIELGTPAEQLPPGGGLTILTTPAPVTAALLAKVCPDAAIELARLDHASVALTVLRYPLAAFPGGEAPAGSGFLVPPREGKPPGPSPEPFMRQKGPNSGPSCRMKPGGRLMTACSFASSKWPHWSTPGEMVLRASAGRWGDGRAMAMDDGELVARLHAELTEVLRLTAEPLASRVTRWLDAFPQYRPGHMERVSRIDAALRRDCPGVDVAGAAFRGVGIPACIAQGRAAGRRALGFD